MKKVIPVIIIGAVAIVLLDTLGAVASRLLHFNYSALSPVSFIIYFIVAFVITKRTNRKTAILSSAFLGLFDGTVGWKLSSLLNADVGTLKIEITPILIMMTALFMILLAAFFGLLGSLLAAKLSKK